MRCACLGKGMHGGKGYMGPKSPCRGKLPCRIGRGTSIHTKAGAFHARKSNRSISPGLDIRASCGRILQYTRLPAWFRQVVLRDYGVKTGTPGTEFIIPLFCSLFLLKYSVIISLAIGAAYMPYTPCSMTIATAISGVLPSSAGA